MAAHPARRRKVKSADGGATEAALDRHERGKDYLSPAEVLRLLETAKEGRHGPRDHLLLLMAYRHRLWVSEAIGFQRDELDLDLARTCVRRLKGGRSVEQPFTGNELRAIKCYLATRAEALPWLFLSERGGPMTYQAVNYLIAAAGERAVCRASTRTCCGTPASMRQPTRARTFG